MFNFFNHKPTNPSLRAKRGNLVLKLTGLHCSSCAVNIDLSLEDLPGVANSTTNYAKSISTIDFDPEKIDPEKIIAEITKLGYKAKESS
ncbi:heavy-metal-associated domain-containing protein [Candidatus Collierbacteria bacterium]|nr:heavy-metal-associated domain-containing protein [Candidatus Collierbacteria bacterium]